MKIVLDIIALVAAIFAGWAVFAVVASRRTQQNDEPLAAVIAGIATTIGGAIILWLTINSFGVIPAGDVGVKLQWSRPTGELVPNGWYIAPAIFGQSVYPMQVTTIQQRDVSNASAATNDLQEVATDVTLNFHLDPSTSSILNVYTNMRGAGFDGVINPLTLEAVKATAADYTAQQLIDERSKVKSQLDNLLRTRLAHYGIVVDNVSLTQFKFSDEFNQAIEAKVTQEQASLQAKARLEQVQYEAKQIVATARAQAQALGLKRQSITETLVEQAAVDKWDGHLPTVMGGGSLSSLPASLFGGK